MIGDLKPYSAYKDSGVPWLGEVPEHWEARKLRSILRAVSQRERPDLPLLSIVREKGVILRDVESKEENHNYIPDDLRNYKVVQKGQFAMNKMKAWQGSYGVSKYDGIVSPAYFIFNIAGVSGDYLHRAIRSQVYVPFFAQSSDGVRIGQWDLSQDRMKEIPFFVPPLEEQTQIATFLDYADRRIRRYIRSKQKLIKLLEEQKQVIINQAVTRGLDPNIPLKPSGIEWLGDIPAHWEVWQIGHFAKVGNGSTPSRGNLDYWQGGKYPWLNSASVNQGEITIANQFVTSLALKECHLPIVPSGSILMAITGQGKTRGTAALLSIEATINRHIAYITPKKPVVILSYLKSFLSAAYPELRRLSEASGSTKGALTCWDISHFKVPVPPIDEQEKIEEDLKKSTQKTNAAINRLNNEIAFFREFRTRLIADVVTGKLDVREAAAHLPVEVDDPEPLDDDLPEEDLALDDDSEPDAAPEDEAA